MIRAFDMILAAQRTVYDGLPTFAHSRSMVHVADVANVIHDSRVTREQDDNPWQDETLDYRVSLCTVAQEVRKLRSMRSKGRCHKSLNMGPNHRYYGTGGYKSADATYNPCYATKWLLRQLGMI